MLHAAVCVRDSGGAGVTTKKCPDCSVPLRVDAVSCPCGWKATPATPKPKAGEREVDAEPWRCAHELLGQRCPEAGAHKRGDRWLCAGHAGKGTLADAVATHAGRMALANAKRLLASAKPLKRVGEARPIGEQLKPYEDAVERRFETTEADTWPAGRE